MHRGWDGVREAVQELFQAFNALHLEFSEIRNLGDRLLAIGWLHARGRESGVEVESPYAYLVQFTNGKAIWVRAFLDHREALLHCIQYPARR